MAKSSKRYFCSSQCRGDHQKEKVKEEMDDRPWFDALCVVCGEKYRNREPRNKMMPRRRSCSASCHRKLSMFPHMKLKNLK
jgi:hypothetical protein